MYIEYLCLYHLTPHIDPILPYHHLPLLLVLPLLALFLEILESLVDLRRVVEKELG